MTRQHAFTFLLILITSTAGVLEILTEPMASFDAPVSDIVRGRLQFDFMANLTRGIVACDASESGLLDDYQNDVVLLPNIIGCSYETVLRVYQPRVRYRIQN